MQTSWAFFFGFLLKEQATASMCESDSEADGHTGTIGGLCFEENKLARACASLARAVLLYSVSVLGVAPMISCVLLPAASFFSRSHSSFFTCTLWIIFMEKILFKFVTMLVLFWLEFCWREKMFGMAACLMAKEQKCTGGYRDCVDGNQETGE